MENKTMNWIEEALKHCDHIKSRYEKAVERFNAAATANSLTYAIEWNSAQVAVRQAEWQLVQSVAGLLRNESLDPQTKAERVGNYLAMKRRDNLNGINLSHSSNPFANAIEAIKAEVTSSAFSPHNGTLHVVEVILADAVKNREVAELEE